MAGVSLPNFVFQQNAATNSNGNAAYVNGLGCYSMDVQLQGDTCVINFEGQCSDVIPGATPVFRAAAAYSVGDVTKTPVINCNADGLYIVPCMGLSQLRARISAHSAGTSGATVQGYGSYRTPVLM